MPELAEVEFYRRRWDAGVGRRIRRVSLHASCRVFRGTDASALVRSLEGARLVASTIHGKQMLFRFSRQGWLGLHLGMTGELRVEGAGLRAGPQDQHGLPHIGQGVEGVGP